MCGIAGLSSPIADDLRPIGAMTAALRHRGPDDEGYVFADSRSGRAWPFAGRDTVEGIAHPELGGAVPDGVDVVLGHRRLSIIDLSPAGHGPMASADGTLWITYNGEIFNYVELRDELAARGHSFRTSSDTEVLLAAYAEWGPAGLDRLNGMWAFALFDARRRVLFAARDRFGVKPFHYAWNGRTLAFASEIEALRAAGQGGAAADARVAEFLLGGALDAGEDTCVAGIRRLPGGHHLTLDLTTRALTVARWYTLPEEGGAPARPERLREVLEDAVRIRLRSDVPVGTCLSGGLDSSSIVALTARLREGPGDGRRAFSVVYPEAGLDESHFVDLVVRATGVEGHRVTPTADELAAELATLVQRQGEPFAGAGVYSQWRVMRLARETGVTVLLDGQGADEVLAGYLYHFGPFLAGVARRKGWAEAAREVGRAASATGGPASRLAALAAYHALPLPAAVRAWGASRAATHPALRPGDLVPEAARAATAGGRHRRRATLGDELRANILETSLPALLRYEDRNSMAFSVEARTPFLDYRLVEEVRSWRAEDLIHDGWTKAPLRQAMCGILPEEVRLRRDKLGFATPERRWLAGLAPRIREWLGPGSRVGRLVREDVLARWRADADLAGRPGLWRVVSAELFLRHLEGTPC
jgi:asparagine synthase (glutamine-hydrolysing)